MNRDTMELVERMNADNLQVAREKKDKAVTAHVFRLIGRVRDWRAALWEAAGDCLAASAIVRKDADTKTPARYAGAFVLAASSAAAAIDKIAHFPGSVYFECQVGLAYANNAVTHGDRAADAIPLAAKSLRCAAAALRYGINAVKEENLRLTSFNKFFLSDASDKTEFSTETEEARAESAAAAMEGMAELFDRMNLQDSTGGARPANDSSGNNGENQ